MDKPVVTSPGWLLKKDNMTLINQCRKQIQMEFDTRLLFSQADLLEQIRDFSQRSRNRKLKELAQELWHRLELSAEAEPAKTETPPPSLRRYRGQSVAVEPSPKPPAEKTTRTVIYRGQLVPV